VPLRLQRHRDSRRPRNCIYNDTLLKRLAQDLEDMTAELGEFIQEEAPRCGPATLRPA